ncbi:patatin-like phospholipase family protein [Clostridium lundense]|uniref:patatin-like phospholipase family protein n=1 Tax=Clostridium lundense TaxID=319475 RepID=UPI000488D338|nr:patatin-like phospholipase family protein [Clostridium lundense]
MNANAIFEGGGMRGIGIIGALSYFEQKGYTWNKVAGTSAGALIASLISAGYSSKNLKDMIINLNFLKFLDANKLQRFPLVGKAIGFVKEKGLYSGDYLEDWVNNLLTVKKIYSFGDLKSNGKGDLKIIASDITKRRILTLPDDLPSYGIDPDSFSISKAVRMSVSIPFYFKPVELKGKDGISYIVDGGICCNFPIDIFDEDTPPTIPTFGFKFNNINLGYTASGKTDPLSFLFDIADTMKSQQDAPWTQEENIKRTVFIPTLGVDPIEFNISKEKNIALFKSGYRSARDFLQKWNFETYIQKYYANFNTN